ncbi:large ribosomal subunit protein uL2mz, N-terminal part-like [Bidens hawaiensis]|uniref:large ribosomal subunit protein uL2mz, N-terminal part-like n=1 Tax=Bidens hawaiensis TaxID=980011 RepID=UPI00404961A3
MASASSSSSFRRLINGTSSLITSRIITSQTRSKHSVSRAHGVSTERPLRQFVKGKSKTAGRNSAGRITIYHRGGGVKRLLRTVDLKRNTLSIGVVERIEYDPNRTSRIALVRWVEGADVDRHTKVNTIENPAPLTRKLSATMPVKGQFSFSSLPGMQEESEVVPFLSKTDHVVVGLPNGSKSPFTSKPVGTQLTNVKDVFLSAFSSKADKTPYSFVNTLGIPRMAVAGSRPDFFVPRLKDDVKDDESLSLDEIKRWDKDSVAWAHKMKRKAAVSWQGIRGHAMSGPIDLAGQRGSKLDSKTLEKQKRDGKFGEDRTPLSYILATRGMEVGTMVMNRGSSKQANDALLQKY